MTTGHPTLGKVSSTGASVQKERIPYRRPAITVFGPVVRMTGSNAGSSPDAMGFPGSASMMEMMM